MHKIKVMRSIFLDIPLHRCHNEPMERRDSMYFNSGYLNNFKYEDFETSAFVDESRPLVVSSCGEYRLKKLPVFITTRPNGRFDYQLLYVAAGKAHFQLEGQDRVYPAGTMVLYRPGEAQEYRYYLEDQPQIFWVHFSGSEVESLLRQYGIGANGPAFSVGLLPEYKRLFRQIIQELQLTKPLFEDLLSTTLMNIFILAGRQQSQDSGLPTVLQVEMEEAIHYFHEHFNQNISIEKYAQGLHISTAWFIHCFKEHTGMTPMQYILSLRISNAQVLLEQANYTVTEIAAIVGYDNPLYFSRIFKKQLGVSPQQYRQQSLRH